MGSPLPQIEVRAPVPPPPAPPPPTVEPAPAAAVAEPDCAPLFSVSFARSSGSATIDRAAAAKMALWLERHPEASLLVDGHADGRGPTSWNLALSHARAANVARDLARAGIPRRRITVRAFGAYQPLAGHAERDGDNRRVSLSVSGAPACDGGGK